MVGADAKIPARLLQQIIDAARAALPNEAVGLIVGTRNLAAGDVPTRFVGLRNAAESPYRYSIEPSEQLTAWLAVEANHEVVWAIFHSHPSSPAVPSATDIELAFFPDSAYLICSLAGDVPVVRAWSIREGHVHEVSLAVLP